MSNISVGAGRAASTRNVPARTGILPGILICLAISFVAVELGRVLPIVGAPLFGILIGIVIGNLIAVPAAAKSGITFCSKKVLQWAIIVLGGSLSLMQVVSTGRESLGVMLVSLTVALLGAWLIGRKLGVSSKLMSLVGVGTAICGGSAIAAVAPVIKADDDEIAFSISTIFLFNVIAVVVFPLIGHLIHLSDRGFGLWAGTAINDTSSVVAASFSYSKAAGDFATITKLTRTTMIIPISLGFALFYKRGDSSAKYNFRAIFPWFILWFLVASLLNTSGVLDLVHAGLPKLAGATGKYLIVVALAGVGLGANFARLIKTGARPILLGMMVWGLVAITSLGMQMLLHQFNY